MFLRGNLREPSTNPQETMGKRLGQNPKKWDFSSLTVSTKSGWMMAGTTDGRNGAITSLILEKIPCPNVFNRFHK